MHFAMELAWPSQSPTCGVAWQLVGIASTIKMTRNSKQRVVLGIHPTNVVGVWFWNMVIYKAKYYDKEINKSNVGVWFIHRRKWEPVPPESEEFNRENG